MADLLETDGIDFHTIEARAKTLESLQNKLSKSGKSFDDTDKQIPDLAGVRVVLYDKRGVSETAALIDKEFDVDSEASSDKLSELAPDQFGYLSIHKVARLKSNRKTMSEWSRFAELHVEIQIRTVLQHAWASISHKLQYKRESEIPSVLRRRLMRLGGLFELADDEFLSLRSQDREVRESIEKKVAAKEKEVLLDLVSVESWAVDNKLMQQIEKAAKQSGIVVSGEDKAPRCKEQLLQVSQTLGYKTLKDLESGLKPLIPAAATFYKELYKITPVYAATSHFAAIVLIAANQDKFSEPKDYPFPDPKAAIEYIDSIRKTSRLIFKGD